MWGTTFPAERHGEVTWDRAAAEFDALVDRLARESMDRLQEEADPVSRIPLFGFPGQVAMLKDRTMGFIEAVFKPSRYETTADLRGFYLTSGTQEGTPIDQVLGAIDRSFGTSRAARLSSGTGRSFFIRDLLTEVVFREAGWVRQDGRARRRELILRGAVFGAIGAVTVGIAGLLLLSFERNRELIRASQSAISEYRELPDTVKAATSVSAPDFDTVLGALHILRGLPPGYDQRAQSTPLTETFGLSQRERLESAATTSYRTGLERMFRSGSCSGWSGRSRTTSTIRSCSTRR